MPMDNDGMMKADMAVMQALMDDAKMMAMKEDERVMAIVTACKAHLDAIVTDALHK